MQKLAELDALVADMGAVGYYLEIYSFANMREHFSITVRFERQNWNTWAPPMNFWHTETRGHHMFQGFLPRVSYSVTAAPGGPFLGNFTVNYAGFLTSSGVVMSDPIYSY